MAQTSSNEQSHFNLCYLRLIFSYNYRNHNESKILSVKLKLLSYPIVLTYVLGAQKNRLIEMVLLGTPNTCRGLEKKIPNPMYSVVHCK